MFFLFFFFFFFLLFFYHLSFSLHGVEAVAKFKALPFGYLRVHNMDQTWPAKPLSMLFASRHQTVVFLVLRLCPIETGSKLRTLTEGWNRFPSPNANFGMEPPKTENLKITRCRFRNPLFTFILFLFFLPALR